MRELTVRAVLSGMLLGVVMCFSNIFVYLKTGWSLGVTVTAVILAYALFQFLQRIGLSKQPFLLLENNAASAVASGAGFMTGGGNMAAMPALLVLTGVRPEGFGMFFWFLLISALGVFVAVPVKRQLINEDKLPFPTGTATAETLKSLYADGTSGQVKARLLGGAGVIGGLVAWLRDAKASWMPFNIPHQIKLPFALRGHTFAEWTLAFEGSLILLGAGAIMSFKAGWSMLLGALLNYAVLAPAAFDRGEIATVSYKGIVTWSLWPGAGILVASALTQFVFQWRSIARAFSAFGKVMSNPDDGKEVPVSWFVAGVLVLSPPLIYLMSSMFGIPVWAGILAIPLGLLMGIVAARVTGETDVTPTKALGPVTQTTFGLLVPGNITANIMSANVTGGMGLHAADLLTSLKAGHLVGANPRSLLVAQLFGVLVGAALIMPAFNLIIPDASMLGSDQFPAPGVLVWANVSKLMVQGISAVPQAALMAGVLGVCVGIALAVLEKTLPKRLSRFVPSPAGFGIAFTIPGYSSIAMAIGAFIAFYLAKKKPELHDKAVVAVGSGFIAGESLVGIGIAILIALGILSR